MYKFVQDQTCLRNLLCVCIRCYNILSFSHKKQFKKLDKLNPIIEYINNHYEEEYFKASTEFEQKYGIIGEKLQTEAELEKARKRGGGGTAHFMDELPEYKEIYDLYMEEESRLEKYREQCQMEALDMLKEYFYLLWD